MIPQGALELFAQSVAKTLHEKTHQWVGHGVSASYFEVNFTFKVGAHDMRTLIVRVRDLERSISWQPIHDKLVEGVMTQIELEKGPGFTLDEFGRRHFRMKAETGFITEAHGVKNH